jgi:hypothetical protein
MATDVFDDSDVALGAEVRIAIDEEFRETRSLHDGVCQILCVSSCGVH